MRTMWVAVRLLVVLSLLSWSVPFVADAARASEPRELIQQTVNEVLKVVGDPALKTPEKKDQRREMLRTAVSRHFNYEEMARRSLATHWKRRTESERRDFIALFARLLESDYARKLEAYSGQRVSVSEQQIRGNFAQVSTSLALKHDQISIVYKLLKINDDWKVYDVLIEGMSLINNFRSQFNRLIISSSYDDLVKLLSVKLEDLNALDAGSKSTGTSQ